MKVKFLFLALILVGCQKPETCEFQYDPYLIEFSENAKDRNPFLDLREYIILENGSQIDTTWVVTKLTPTNERTRDSYWICPIDSTVAKNYSFRYSMIEAFFRIPDLPSAFVFSNRSCPLKGNPMEYSEMFHLSIASGFSIGPTDTTRAPRNDDLIRFNTDMENNIGCPYRFFGSQLGEFYEEMIIDNEVYENIWYGNIEFFQRQIETY
jgi:hypothetical protein